jgi:hypothetical protein
MNDDVMVGLSASFERTNAAGLCSVGAGMAAWGLAVDAIRVYAFDVANRLGLIEHHGIGGRLRACCSEFR